MNCRVVLVRTEVAANIGATARAMCNFGLADLVLVAPAADPRSEHARVMAAHGEEVLESCRVVAELGDALADCVQAAATSARTGGLYRAQSVGTLDDIMPRVVQALSAGPTALVFGPERNGLTNEEVSRCSHLIHIATNPRCPALNLAHCVAICLYELQRTALGQASPPTRQDIAPFADRERMLAALQESLARIGYLSGPKADILMHGLRQLIERAGPSPMEVGLLMGLARQIAWFAEHPATDAR
jgi:tRNA/rRNA methyltransferase